MKIVAKLDIPSEKEMLARLNLQSGGLVQKVIDTEIIRWCTDYVPFDEGVLTQSAYAATRVGSGLIVYDTPYARYQYYGEVYGPNFQVEIDGEKVWRSPPGQLKHPTGRQLNYNLEKHPKAGSHWFERAMADHKNDVLNAAREVVRRG